MVSCGQYFRASVRRQLMLPPLWLERRGAAPAVTIEHAGPLVLTQTEVDWPDLETAEAFEELDWPDAPLPEELEGSRANAGDEAEPIEVAKAEPVSRPAAGRSAAATSELMDATAGETAPICLQSPATDARLSIAGTKDAGRRQSADTLRAERERPGAGVTAGETAPHSETAEPGFRTADSGGGREARAPEGTSGTGSAITGYPANARERHKPAALPLPPAERIDLSEATSAMDGFALRSEGARIAAVQQSADAEGKVLCRCGASAPGAVAGMVPAWFGQDCIEGDCPLRAGTDPAKSCRAGASPWVNGRRAIGATGRGGGRFA